MILEKAYYGDHPVTAIYYGRYLLSLHSVEIIYHSKSISLKLGNDICITSTDTNISTKNIQLAISDHTHGNMSDISNGSIDHKFKITSSTDGVNVQDENAILGDAIFIKSLADAMAKDISGGRINGNVSIINDIIGRFSNMKGSPIKGNISTGHTSEASNADIFTSPVTANTEIRHCVPAFNAEAKESPISGNSSVQHIVETDKSDTNGALSNVNIDTAHTAKGEIDKTKVSVIKALLYSLEKGFGAISNPENTTVCAKIQSGNNIHFIETLGQYARSDVVIKLNSSAIGEFLHTISSDAKSVVAPDNHILSDKGDTSASQMCESVALGATAHAETVDTEKYRYPILLSFAEDGDEHTVSVLIELTDEYPVDNVSEPKCSGEDNYIIEIIQEEN